MTVNDSNPDYIVFGETRSLSYEENRACGTALFSAAQADSTNTDLTAPSGKGIIPACRAYIAHRMATGRLFVASSPLMMRHAIKKLGVTKADEAAIIGDRMDTDIIAGIESELDLISCSRGVASMETIKRMFPYPSTCVPRNRPL